MKRFSMILPAIILFVCVVGCKHVDPQRYPLGHRRGECPKPPSWHTIRVPERTNVTVTTADKFNIIWWFGNVDDPVPPEWYRPGKPFRHTGWWFRNPFHNFTFYVVGIADKEFARAGRYPETIGNPNGGWNFSVCELGFLRLPCLSYHRGMIDCYAGWRAGGNFGLKFNIKKPSG